VELQAAMPISEAAARTGERPTLDSLAQLCGQELEALFASGQGDVLANLNGHPAGRMLAVPGLEAAPVASVLRQVAKSRLFVWEGKSFASAPGGSVGRGINRVRLFGRRMLFPFQTRVAASLVDGRPCLAILYDVPENPWFARSTYDELRLVGEGLYLGRGMRRRRHREPQLLVWFALDAAHPDAPIRWEATGV